MNDIPENIQRFLKPQGSISNQVENEKKDILDDVLTKEDIIEKIESEYEENKVEYSELSPLVNPFEVKENVEVDNSVLKDKEENVEILSSSSNGMENTTTIQEDVAQLVTNEDKNTIEYNEIEMPSNPFNSQSSSISAEIIGETEEKTHKSLQEQLNEITYESVAPTIENLNANYDYNKIERIEPIKDIEIPKKVMEVEIELSDENGELSLPKIINKVRDFSKNLGRASALIDVEEIDLPDKYQITIEIKKN